MHSRLNISTIDGGRCVLLGRGGRYKLGGCKLFFRDNREGRISGCVTKFSS